MSKKTLNQTNLAALGPERLADLLLEISTGSADIKRRLRFELSHELGPTELARDLRKRFVSLRKARSFVGWRKRKALIRDLQNQADMICDKVAADNPALGLDLLWEFVSLAPTIYERTDDSRGDVGDVFRAARDQFAQIAPRAAIDPVVLAERVWDAIRSNEYGQFDALVDLLGPSLQETGLTHLKALVLDETPSEGRLKRRWLQEIAAAQGDTESNVAQYSASDLKRADIAAEVAQLWLQDGRVSEALALLDAVEMGGRRFGQEQWDKAYIACLLQAGRVDDAQAHRWTRFEQELDISHLRAYLKALPDFDDIQAEDRAKAYALGFGAFDAALSFFLQWPDLDSAASLIETRNREINGDAYWLLTPASEALHAHHPLAATLTLRAMIDYTLGQGRSSRYGHAASHLGDCATLDLAIADYGEFPTHSDYVKTLNHRHGFKTSFWNKL